MSTIKLFWKDPYLTSCTATVICVHNKKVKVDQTVFFAFSGGQESDEGTIGGIKVLQALKEGDKENIADIEYELEKEPDFKAHEKVEIYINEGRRRKLRSLHSAAHIVYYFVAHALGELKVIGSNIAEDKARMDFLYPKPLHVFLSEIEEKTNTFLQENHEIIMQDDYEKPELRWWICEDWKMPCGGTHVKNTREIGKIRLKRKNIGAGKERIEIFLV